MADLSLPGETEPTFKGVMEAVKRRLRLSEGDQTQRLMQNVRSAGLRTSGVGQIPQLAASRARQLAEAQGDISLGETRLGQLGALEQLERQAQLESMLMRERYGLEGDAAKTAARRGLQSALIGSGLDVLTTWLKRTPQQQQQQQK